MRSNASIAFANNRWQTALREPIHFPTITQVIGVFVATAAATADVLCIGVDHFVITHVVAPIRGRMTRLTTARHRRPARKRAQSRGSLRRMVRATISGRHLCDALNRSNFSVMSQRRSRSSSSGARWTEKNSASEAFYLLTARA